MSTSGIETPPDLPREVPLRRNSGFRLLWVGQLLSDTGSMIGVLFAIIPALRQHGISTAVIGLVQAGGLRDVDVPAK